jgi:hypothetical protein
MPAWKRLNLKKEGSAASCVPINIYIFFLFVCIGVISALSSSVIVP